MAEKIVDILAEIQKVKGQEYVSGLVAGINMMTKEPESKEE